MLSFQPFYRYLSFVVARKVNGEYVRQQIYTILRVLHWLKSTAAQQNRPYTDFMLLRHDKQVGNAAPSHCLHCIYQMHLICGCTLAAQ